MEKEPLINLAQHRFEATVQEFVDNGFTEEQAIFLVKKLDEFIPLV